MYNTPYLSIKEYDQQLSGVGIFILSPKKKHAVVFACIVIIQTYTNMYSSEKTTKQQTSQLNLEGGWEQYCARHSLSRSSLHSTVPKEQKLC